MAASTQKVPQSIVAVGPSNPTMDLDCMTWGVIHLLFILYFAAFQTLLPLTIVPSLT